MVVHQLQSKVRFRFEPPWYWLNLELDIRFGSGKSPNLELNFEFGSAGSGSNLGSEPNIGITRFYETSTLTTSISTREWCTGLSGNMIYHRICN